MARLFSRTAANNATVPSSLSQVNGRGVWRETAREFLVEQKARAKASGIRLSSTTTTKALELIAAANPAVADALSEALVPVAVNAFQQWPIRKRPGARKTKTGKERLPGFSKSQLLLRYRSKGSTEFAAVLVNRADYAAAINRGATGRSLIFVPGRKAALRAADKIARALGKQGSR